jgi:hypothetical protein
MIRLVLNTALVFVFSIFTASLKSYAQTSTKGIFINWNKSTFKSLSRQSEAAIDSTQKAIYQNRQLAIKEYWKIKSINDISNQSVRYKFLKLISQKLTEKKKDFYIIEANESGSKVLLRNFVLYFNSSDTAFIDFYEYFNDEWHITGGYIKGGLSLVSDFKSYIVPFGKGFNYDDIIITEFKDKQVKKSEYYLYTTLSAESKIRVILSGYRKENFIK